MHLRRSDVYTGVDCVDVGPPHREGPVAGYTISASCEQALVWLRLGLFGPSPVNHRCAGAWIDGPVDAARVEQATLRLGERHDLLRTTFREQSQENGEPRLYQVIAGAASQRLVRIEGGDWSEEEVLRRAGEAARSSLDPRDEPPWRIYLIRQRAGRHLAVLVVHALLADADSDAESLLKEWQMLVEGTGPMAGQVTGVYTQHLRAQAESLETPQTRGAIAWWQAQHASAPALLELPVDRPRSPVPARTGGRVSRRVGDDLPAALTAAATRAGVDVETVALAGLLAVLHRYTGQAELVVEARAARPAGKLRLGPVADRWMLRVTVAPAQGFEALLERTRAAIATAQEHGALASLVAAMTTRAPGCQVYFHGTCAEPSAVALDLGVVGHELELSIDLRDGLLVAAYDRDLFEADTVARLLGHWEMVLVAGLAEPARPIAKLALLVPAELQTIVHQWNATDAPHVGPDCLHGLFAAQVARTPEAPAVVGAGVRLSYRELHARATRLAWRLRALGVGVDVPVGLFLDRSLELAVGVLAILMAGGTYVPLDPAYPAERVGWIVADSGAVAMVTTSALAAALPECQAQPVLVDAPFEASPVPLPRTDPGDLAYVIYTSGSTGRPKGIGMPHAALVNLIEWHAEALLGGARTLQFAALGFDVCFYEMFTAWRTGGSVHMIEEAVRHDVARLGAVIEAEAIEKVILPVVVLQQLAEEFADRPEVLRSLKEVTTTGEQMHLTAPVIALFERLPHCTLHNHYGPAETHVVTAFALPEARSQWVPHPPIGRPIANTRVRVLDPHMNLCPVGVPGELYLGGEGLARGYWNRPDLTAERFVPDPFATEPGARLYRTGDITRQRPDGTLEYLGRRDDQVKIRGVRVELGEVLSAISRHPRVQEAVVIAREDTPGERRLVAYFVPTQGEAAGEVAIELRAFLRRSLTEAMIPTAFVGLRELPLTPNGKIDKRALPRPEDEATAGTSVPPRSELEVSLAAIWQDVLKVERVGAHDDFFALGGHSLLATQVLARVRRTFGVELALAELYAGPTVAGLAALVRARRAPASEASPIEPARRDGPLPLSLAQERLFFLHRLAPESTAYNCPHGFRLRGRLDAAALQRGLDGLVARHEALRTTFLEVEGQARQVIAARGAVPLRRFDLRGLPDELRALELERRLAVEVRRPFDLERGPLVRGCLVQLADEEHFLLLDLHHIVTDGWSMRLLLDELAALYEADVRGEEASLAPLGLQFADYAAWERGRLQQGLERSIAWWRETLADAPRLLPLPTDRPRPNTQSFRGGAVALRPGAEVSAALRRIGAPAGLSPTLVLLAGFAALLHRYTGEPVIVLGMPTAARDRVELEGLVGFFVNTLPIRVDLAGDPSFLELLAQVRKTTLAAYDHDAVPFDRIVQELRPERTLSHNPIVQVGFAPQPPGARALRLAGLQVESVEADVPRAIFDLTLYVSEEAGELAASLEYSADLFERATIERMGEHLLALLRGAIARPQGRVSQVPILGPEERADVVTRWNRTAAAPGRPEMMHALVARAAAQDPARVAVTLGDERLTYAELERRAGALARHLAARGVGAESLVAISVERSLELVIAVVAVLKAGAAFLPLDPAYPAERLAFMLEDSGARVVLTQARLAERFAGREVIRLDADHAAIDADPTDVTVADDPARAAYVIYTSGSTGRPKGVVVEHRSAVNLARAQRALFGLTEASVVLQFSALSFDAFVFELLLAWGVGATLCLLPPRLPVPGPEFSELLRSQRVSMCVLPPSVLAAMADDPLPDLVHVVAAGEACSAELVARWGRGRRFVNAYGPTETTVCATAAPCEPGEGPPPIGRPLVDVQVYVLDPAGNPAPVGVFGELYVGGAGVARGYLGRPALTAERFVPDPFSGVRGARLYRTGDRVRWRADGQLEFAGRLDRQVKLRGFRIELGEVEAVVRAHPEVQDAAVVAARQELVAYVVPRAAQARLSAAVREFARARLPGHMVPSAVVVVEAFPTLPNGKVDVRALAERSPRAEARALALPRSQVEQALAAIWREVLNLEQVGIDEPFFELGGHSLLLARVRTAIEARFGRRLDMVELFQHPTIRSLAGRLAGATAEVAAATTATRPEGASEAIAIVGMAGRFPGADDVEALWQNLLAGVEGIRFADAEELTAAGVDPALRTAPGFVPAFGRMNDAFCFDAAFFGYSPQEARLMDPQQRVFLEAAFAALEDAGCDPARGTLRVGVFGGCDAPRHWLALGGSAGGIDEFQRGVANIPDNLTSRVAYKLGLRGPAVTVLSACSTSLVAVHLASQSLRAGECDVALAGGAAVAPASVLGHVHEDGSILSPDGHCRPFDAEAGGTVAASGVGVVVLKRLADALRDGDAIRAVIRGSAIGNDGAEKVGYTAPGLQGQVDVLRRAYAAAEVSPASVALVEAHGTATRLGDPIEVAALTQVFRGAEAPVGSCALGSVKSNLGHLSAAAGVTGLIKATLALERGQIPPTLHFRRPNPELHLEESPFFVNTAPVAWPAGAGPRRAGVSAFGVGGTNAHVVLEEAPAAAPSGPGRPWPLLPLSARTSAALASQAERLAAHLRARPSLPLADVAYTLQRRAALAPARCVVVCRDSEGAQAALSGRSPGQVVRGQVRARAPQVVFVFPGGGSQHVDMGRELYAHLPVFRAALDECAALFERELGEDIRTSMFPPPGGFEAAKQRLLAPSRNMASIFAVEYALSLQLMRWGLRPAALFGHSLGEYVAAAIAGVFSLADAVALVATRGALCDAAPPAAMVAVPLAVTARLPPGLSVAAINGPEDCVIAGAAPAIEPFVAALQAEGIEARRLPIATASHSELMEPLVERLVERARKVAFAAPQIAMISGVTGAWIEAEIRDPAYWGRHLRQTVRFADGVATLHADPDFVCLEVGPGGHLASFIRNHPDAGPDRLVVATMAHWRSGRSELEALMLALGQLWCAGATIDWEAFTGEERRRKVPLPTYPFARTRHALELRPAAPTLVLAPPPPEEPESASEGMEEAPRDGLAAIVAEIWREALGVARVRDEDNFFDLGGTSLTAVKIRARVRERFGVTTPVHALLEHPNFADFVAALRSLLGKQDEVRGQSLLVQLRPGRPGTRPIFLVQPIGGTVYTYLPLARHLDAGGAAIFGVRASGTDPGEPVLDEVPAMAERYVADILRVQPEGPYTVGGHSAGGITAYEVARQLEARGHAVRLLILDAPSMPAVYEDVIATIDDFLRSHEAFASCESTSYQSFVAALETDEALRQIVLATCLAEQRYKPRPISAEVVYFAASEQRDARDTHAGMYWLDLVEGEFSLYRTPGDHFTMMDEPWVETLARLIDRHLARELPRRA
ncbi:amino acid adenylation domain-containing protein [Nannocystis exedens]|uniref:Amino acid adenylation domain-containing protein n=1 Tax=Nannocystis exedens TaxID=54 RepID=A0A1I2EQH1_9BACT|nr:non-ribosomal peptide synthetase/type I polyketide synthase [Nannocystis exedens]PCC73853.1 non-ribosomal peptide synthetase [Nannocystis exedens]SFE95292.1 amino acid adenylation domain-containing protein [Nannocystis exedens]